MTTNTSDRGASQTHFLASSLRAVLFLMVVAMMLHATGCSRSASRAVQLQKTNAFTRFKKIESIKIEWWHNFKERVIADVPESNGDTFESIFEYGIRDPNAV